MFNTFAMYGGLALAIVLAGEATRLGASVPGMREAAWAGTTVARCRVVDGDTLRCGSEHIRLIGIDYSEKGSLTGRNTWSC